MIRTAPLLLLWAVASLADASTLYRWVEADGSITFSPSPPADGIEYETINPQAATLPTPATPSTNTQPTRRPDATPVRDTDTPAIVHAPEQATSAASATLRSANPPARLENRPSGADSRSLSAATDTAPNLGAATSTADTEALELTRTQRQKYRQCAELAKRVTSLENRLRARLTPEAMDQTVLRMVRYQDSIDRHCN